MKRIIDHCGCKYYTVREVFKVSHCSVHQAAGELLEACKLARRELRMAVIPDSLVKVHNVLDKVITQAAGGGEK